MADRAKKKLANPSNFNSDRPNGKAPKKHPKPQRVLSDEERAERDRKAAERRIQRDQEHAQLIADEMARHRRFINRKHGEALKINRAFNAMKRREMSKPAADAIKRMVGTKS